MEDLKHYGVKGMKWGVRKTSSQISTVLKQRRYDRKTSRKIAKKNLRSRHTLYKMSDSELREKLNRINMENNYNQAAAKSVQLNRSIGTKAILKLYRTNEGKAILKSGISAGAKKIAVGAVSAGSPGVAAGAMSVSSILDKK